MKKILSWVLLVAMLLTSSTAALAENEKIKIVFQHSMEEHVWEAMRGTIEQFMIDNPNIEVECVHGGTYNESVAKMMTVHAAALQGDKNGYPTIHQTVLGSLATFAESGVIAPLDDLFKATGFPIDKYFEGMRQAYSYNGIAYGVPSFASVAPTMYYNKTLAEEAGATVPQTWDEMEAWLEKLTV